MTASRNRTAVARSGRALLLACAAALALILLPPVGAFAHGGGIRLEAAGDGAGGIDVVVTWKKDKHPVAESVAMTAVAVGPAGQKVGPTRIMSAAEGVGFYHADLQLAPGHWKVTVSATEPTTAKATFEVTVKQPTTTAGDSPAPVVSGEPAGRQNSTQPDGVVQQAAPDAAKDTRHWVPLVGAALVVLAAIFGLVVARRRRSAGGR
ncbi:hypothetical protein [Micromonospora sp. SL4-19]|uniref:hypothetical protein n=1 Tax=Micromonospora sp. SL4-19 TaxID=3399129 RepID=UPI003A4E4315